MGGRSIERPLQERGGELVQPSLGVDRSLVPLLALSAVGARRGEGEEGFEGGLGVELACGTCEPTVQAQRHGSVRRPGRRHATQRALAVLANDTKEGCHTDTAELFCSICTSPKEPPPPPKVD